MLPEDTVLLQNIVDHLQELLDMEKGNSSVEK